MVWGLSIANNNVFFPSFCKPNYIWIQLTFRHASVISPTGTCIRYAFHFVYVNLSISLIIDNNLFFLFHTLFTFRCVRCLDKILIIWVVELAGYRRASCLWPTFPFRPFQFPDYVYSFFVLFIMKYCLLLSMLELILTKVNGVFGGIGKKRLSFQVFLSSAQNVKKIYSLFFVLFSFFRFQNI